MLRSRDAKYASMYVRCEARLMTPLLCSMIGPEDLCASV